MDGHRALPAQGPGAAAQRREPGPGAAGGRAGIGVHASPAAVEAALGVGALLVPDTEPARVPGTGSGRRETAPTQVMPSGSQAHGRRAHQPERLLRPARPERRHQPAPADGAAVRTGTRRRRRRPHPRHAAAAGRQRRPPTSPPGPPSQQSHGDTQVPSGSHPGSRQLSAARRRNEQTEVQYLDPSQRPVRGAARPPAGRPSEPPPGYQQRLPAALRPAATPQQRARAGRMPAAAAAAAAAAEPRPSATPSRSAGRSAEPAPRQQPRSRNPM